MNDRRLPSQPDDILRRLGTQVVPVDEPERVEQRREHVVAALSRAIRDSADRKRRALRTRLVLGLGVAASLALGLGAVQRVRHRGADITALSATVAEVHGAVVVTEEGESRVLAHGSPLSLRSLGEIETASDAQAEIRSQKSILRIAAATKLTVLQATNVEERYRLAIGRVDVSVDKNSRLLRSVVVETPNAEVVVHGTVFAVGVSRTDHIITDVSVTRGSVWVLANGVQVALLGPGQHWSSDVPLSPAAPTSAPAPAPLAAPAPVTDPVARNEATHGRQHEAGLSAAKASALAEESRMFQDAIDARNRGDDARAVELFSHLVARYPSYEEAEVQLFRAEKRLGRSAAATAEARRYLALHPQGFAHEEARALALSSSAAPSATPPR
ncbi:MAG: FecR domain-containing protein [Polyangiaceae bacterium]